MMFCFNVCLINLILTVLHSYVQSTHTHMERAIQRETFKKRERSDILETHELVFAIKQRNLDVLDEMLLDRSNPKSINYQNWLTFDQVGEITSNKEGSEIVKQWLMTSGAKITWESSRSDYITAEHSIEKWEELLKATFFEFEDLSRNRKKDTKLFHRSDDYSVPNYIQPHLSAVFNTVQVPPQMNRKNRVRKNIPFKTTLRLNNDFSMTDSSNFVTISFLSKYYKVGSNLGIANQSQSVFETDGESFSQTDLNLFQSTNGIKQQNAVAISGYETSQCSLGSSGASCNEGNLDIQYIMGMSQRTTSIYWYVSSNQDPFVAWITEVSNNPNPPQSNSISWGEVEQTVSPSVKDSFNTEALKVAIMGVTVVVASGDDGAPNSDENGNCLCNKASSSSQSSWSGPTHWSGYGYFPSFPATSPYVTAVGATMGPNEGSSEIACQSQLGGVITSGGGFSTYYPQPSWQTSAVNNYFNSLGTLPAAGYNAKGRAYPDVSLIGVNYAVVIANELNSIYGTSCTAPVFSAFVSLINAKRFRNGLPTVGFINPTLYSLGINSSTVFNDIQSGNNKCCGNSGLSSQTTCCASGFTAAPGWDPATGWGSISFDQFSSSFYAYVPYYPPDTSSNDSGPASSTNGVITIIIEVVIIIVVVSVVVYGIRLAYGCCCVVCCGYKRQRNEDNPAIPQRSRRVDTCQPYGRFPVSAVAMTQRTANTSHPIMVYSEASLFETIPAPVIDDDSYIRPTIQDAHTVAYTSIYPQQPYQSRI